jgi:hypothetical protein
MTLIVLSPDHDMGMGMASVVVIDSDPVELRLQIPFHLLYEVPDEGLEVREVIAIIRRHDDPELVPVTITAVHELAAINFFPFRPIELARFA